MSGGQGLGQGEGLGQPGCPDSAGLPALSRWRSLLRECSPGCWSQSKGSLQFTIPLERRTLASQRDSHVTWQNWILCHWNGWGRGVCWAESASLSGWDVLSGWDLSIPHGCDSSGPTATAVAPSGARPREVEAATCELHRTLPGVCRENGSPHKSP